jgi:N-methylhydantoinase A
MSATRRRFRLAVDTGGTFTDVVAIDEQTGALHTTKTPSTPADPSAALLAGVRKIADNARFSLQESSLLVHGTTTATNAVLQRDFGRLGLIVTRGMRHILEIARQSVPDGYGNSYFWVKPPRPVTLERVCEVGGRLAPDGSEVEPLAEEDVRAAVETFKHYSVDCIAVCLLHAYANDAQERRIGELLAELMPEAHVSLSSVVLPEYREYERAMTTILDVMVKPFTREYLVNADEQLRKELGDVPFLIMQSNGGVMSAAEISSRPITTLLSGPAAGVLAASFIGERAGYRNLLTLDAGGTSTDVCLVEDLRPLITTETRVDQYPVKTPMLDIVAVGTGGGSIAALGPQGALRVGPASAGADPGPMCYDRGGTRSTVTDANLVLGRIPPHLLGGEVPLSLERARAGIAEIADGLGLSLEEAAAGVLEIAAWNQANGIRRVSIQRGHDPADYCLVAFGGSGGLLAGEVATALGIQTVLVPPNPGNVSALGLQVSDIRRDYVRTHVRNEDEADAEQLEQIWLELEREGREDLRREGVADDRLNLVRSADVRYVGEAHECPVVVPEGQTGDAAAATVWSGFHDVHERLFGFAYRGIQRVEVVNLRVQAVGAVHRPPLTQAADGATSAEPVADTRRDVYFDGSWTPCPIYRREALVAGAGMSGPAVIEEYGSTTIVFRGWGVRVDPDLNLLMTHEER